MRVLIRALVVGVILAGTPLAHGVADPAPESALANAAASARVRATLLSMTEAARATDVGKYMTFVSDADPLFLHEQRAWATNLRKKPPLAFTFELAEGGEVIADMDLLGATADVSLTWRPAPDPQSPDEKPEPISVTFPARFVTTADTTTTSRSPWLFAGVAWEEELTAPDGSRVLCMTADREKAERLLAILPAALASAAECFETETPTATVKLYPTLELLNASISPGLTSPIAGWNEPGEAIKLGAPAVGSDAEAILVHEAAHQVQFTLGPKPNDAPWWVLEGSAERAAELAAGPDDPGWDRTDRVVRRWARSDRLANFADLAVYDERMPAGVERAYIQGHHLIRYLDETFTPEARNRWIRLLMNGTPIDEASEAAFGKSFGEIDQSWRASLVEPADADDEP